MKRYTFHQDIFVFVLCFWLYGCAHTMTQKEIDTIIQKKYINADRTMKHLDKYSKIISGHDAKKLQDTVAGKLSSTWLLPLQNDILYAKILFFDNHVANTIKSALTSKQYRGMIIDLRQNNGGLFTESVALTDLFLDRGVIVYKKTRADPESYAYKAQPKEFFNIPLVILVDKMTASASEIFAGSLQYHKRAVVIGTKTYGKGTIQEIIPVSANKILKLTVAQYQLPGYKSVEGKGLKPDIEILDHAGEYCVKTNMVSLHYLANYQCRKKQDNTLLIGMKILHRITKEKE
jgi:C-terminal processing protease CtpA/Prc